MNDPAVMGIVEACRECLHHLEAPVMRVTGWDTPYPHSLEWAYFPGPVRLREAIKRVMED